MLKMKPAVLALALAFSVAPVAAQDPITTIREAYKIQFENEWVRVVRVHYAAGATLPVHTHPGGTTAYVCLNDSEGVVFRHAGGSNRAVTRPAVKAGSLRVAAGSSETHNAEISDQGTTTSSTVGMAHCASVTILSPGVAPYCALMPGLDAAGRPADPNCPTCQCALVYVDTEVSSGAFRPQAASMPLIAIHYYDCPSCKTCWKLGQRLLPDPIRQILRDTGA